MCFGYKGSMKSLFIYFYCHLILRRVDFTRKYFKNLKSYFGRANTAIKMQMSNILYLMFIKIKLINLLCKHKYELEAS